MFPSLKPECSHENEGCSRILVLCGTLLLSPREGGEGCGYISNRCFKKYRKSFETQHKLRFSYDAHHEH